MKTELKVKFLQHLNQKKREEGFTLIELLVVVIIIGILAAVALPSLLSQANKAKQVEARNNIGAMNRAQQSFQLENSGRFATSIGGLGIGIRASQNYTFDVINPGGDPFTSAINVASQVGAAGLKGYKGLVYNAGSGTEALTFAILCEAGNVNAQAVDPSPGGGTVAPSCDAADKDLSQ